MTPKWLAEDPLWLKYKRAIKLAQRLTVDEYIKEVLTTHSNRRIRTMTKINGRRLASASMQDQSFRSRYVQMRMEALEVRTLLDYAIDAMRGYLTTAHKERIVGRTINERDSRIDNILKDGLLEIHRIDSLMDITREAIDDIDHASFTIKHTLDSLNVAVKGEYHV